MLCAPGPEGPKVLIMGILALVLCSCSDLVFIHTESSLYSLPCSPIEMGVADPTYHWGQDRPVPRLLSVTKEGHLLFQHFQAADSGKYSCTISYTKRRIPVSQTFHYSVLGYHVPGGLDTVLLFHSKFCEDEWTKRFLHDLQDMLRQLEMEQRCKLQLNATFCFPSLHSPSDEFTVQVQLEVSPFGPNWDEHCNSQDLATVTDCYRKTVWHNLGQVQLALATFFKERKSFLITRPGIPSINFTNEFVGSLRTEQCSAGYGHTKQFQRCLDCCTVSIVHKMPALLLIVLLALLILNIFFILSSCYLFYQDYRLQFPRASKLKGSTMRMERMSHFFRSPKRGPQGLLGASDTRSDKEQRDGASSPAMALNLAGVTDETTPVLAPEKRRSTS
ncbi:zona pellucida-binding protein 2-like protein [Amazona aestiva]|uniref:Zona pellucida-binding protein 2-like protein n=1 Tax=Amazona aestiva TaxID=12930 RepID=A0A0Q3MA81_AMAAE|nr:zona pellucida-binding protein 2-like protein [Amazona aestiva]